MGDKAKVMPARATLRVVPSRSVTAKGGRSSVTVFVTAAPDEIVSAVVAVVGGPGMRLWSGAIPNADRPVTLAWLGAESWGRCSGSIVDEYPTAPAKLSDAGGIGVAFTITYTRDGAAIRKVAVAGAWGGDLRFVKGTVPARPDDTLGAVADAVLAACGWAE